MSNKHQNKRWFSIFHPEKFHLMLYYSITSFIVIGIVSFLVGEVFSRMEKNALIERSENYAGYIVKNIKVPYQDLRKHRGLRFAENTASLDEYLVFNRLDKV